jgi:hypothetical protein
LRDIKLKDGMLKFENEEHLTNCRNELSTMSQEQIIDWQKSIGFVSLMSKINEAQEEMRKVEEKYPNIESDANDYYAFIEANKVIAQKYKSYMEIDENANIISKNWIDANIAWVSNTQNLYKINNSIYYMDSESIIISENGNINDINQAKVNKQSSESLGIYYIKIENSKASKSRGGAYIGTAVYGNNTGVPSAFNSVIDWNTNTGSKCKGSTYKTTIYLRLYGATNVGATSLTHNLIVEGYNQKKNLVGGWAATYSPTTSVSGNYYTNNNGNTITQKIHYFNYISMPPYYQVYPASNSASGLSYYNFPYGTKTVTGTTATYNFSGNFNTIVNHHCGQISVGL